VCLPVPTLAASGLAVPLPAIVYRVAVALAERTQEVAVRVPGFGAVVAETTDSPRLGTIEPSAQERAAAGSASVVAADEDADEAPAHRERRRPVAGAVLRETRAAHPVPHPARDEPSAGTAGKAEPRERGPVVSGGQDATAPPTVPSEDESADRRHDGTRTASATPAQAGHGSASPRPSEQQRSPAESSRPQDPKREAPTGGANSDGSPAVSDTPNRDSTPVTPSGKVDTPRSDSPVVTPPVRVDVPKTDPLPVTPPAVDPPKLGSPTVTPPDYVDTPNTGSLPVTSPVNPNGAVDIPQLPGEPQAPLVPELPTVPGRRG
jgi:hypothetical protein